MITFNLNSIMKERNLSINKISNDTKINRASLTSIANNESKMIQLNTIETLINYLKVPLNEFIYDDQDALKIEFKFIKYDYLNYFCTINFDYKNNRAVDLAKLNFEKLSNNDIKLNFDNLNYNEMEEIEILTDSDFSILDDEDNQNTVFDAKELFAIMSIEKQKSISNVIFEKIINELSFLPNKKDLLIANNSNIFEENQTSVDDYKDILNNIDLTKSIFFVDNVFSGELSNIFISESANGRHINDLPNLSFLFSGNGYSDLNVEFSSNDASVHVKISLD